MKIILNKSYSINSYQTPYFAVLILAFFLLALPAKESISQTNLQTPQIDSVSVLPNINRPIISWFPNTDNTEGYEVFFLTLNEFNIPIMSPAGIVMGIDSTSFIHHNDTVSPCDEFITYSIRAINLEAPAPGNTSPWSDTLRTIYLHQPQHDICANDISLNWTDYINMVEELDRYQILASADGTNYAPIGNTAPDITNFIHTDPLPDIQYSYKIRAFNEDGTRTSTSCAVTIYSRTYPRPEFTNIITATVQDNSFIHLDWEADTLAPILRFDIERRAANENTFTIVQSFADNAGYEPQTLTDDLTADFTAWSYEYRVVMWDSCDQNPRYSQITRTVHLSGEPLPDYTNRLQWNHYDGWNSGVARYNIYRSTDGMFVQIDDVPGSVNEYSDDISAFSGTGGVFNYYVEAVENDGNNALSKSNQITLETETRVEAPNAFIPGALPPDDEFKPIVNFIAVGSYELMIFNKWGEMIFITRDTEEGWDGRQNGELLPPGAYVYLIKYRTPEGKNLEKRGTVTIIR
jgi:gliding motility-associated-like protein